MQLELPYLRPDSSGKPAADHRSRHSPNEPPPRSAPPPHRASSFTQSDPAAPEIAIEFVRVPRARKYILRVRPDGALRVTIPRGGTRKDAELFVAKHRRWAERERARVAELHAPVQWREGDMILLHGQRVPLTIEHRPAPQLVVGGQRVPVKPGVTNLRDAAEAALREMAARLLVPRVFELARQHGLTVTRVTIRNQRSRWGSCSRCGTIALNFRLVQMPPAVCEYVLLHELMHLRQQNHSRRYWRLVEQVCPAFREAERWLRAEGRSLF